MFKIGMIDQVMTAVSRTYLMLILLAYDWSTPEQKIIIKQNLTKLIEVISQLSIQLYQNDIMRYDMQ
jgi:hypothetical protein